jgi:exonuclease SbcD
MSSFQIIGDPHIGKGTNLGRAVIGSNINSRVIDQINLLEWNLQKAIDNDISHIILTGDVFDDPKPSTSIISTFLSWLNKCQSNSINVHIIAGNHDVLRSGVTYSSPLDIIEESSLEGIYVYRNINTLIMDGVAVTFVPFRDRKSFLLNSNSDALDYLKTQLTYELSSIPATYKKVLVGHLAIEGSLYVGDEIDDLSNELMCSLDLFEGYDYVWMGHIHKPQVINDSPHIAHIGSMDISDFGEVDHEKKIVIFDTSNQNYFEYVRVPTRKLNKISISIPEEVEDISEYVLNEIKTGDFSLSNSITKLEIDISDKSKALNKSKIEKFLLSHGVFNVSSILESKKQVSLKKDTNKINSKMDVASAIKQWADSYLLEGERGDYIEIAIDIYKEFQEEAN